MKAVLEFNLPEETAEHTHAIKGGDYIAALQEFDDKLRSELKYNSELTLESAKVYKEIRDSLHEICAGLDFSVWD